MVTSLIIQKILTLYINIFLGFLCAKHLKINGSDLAKLIFYIVTPFVIFQGVIKADLDSGVVLTIPLITYLICTFICLLYFKIAKKYWPDNNIRNIVALSAGTANTGFIGLPVTMAITGNDPNIIGLYITAMLGVSLFENTIGFFIASGSYNQTLNEVINRLLKLPILYAFIFGASFNVLGLRIDDFPKPILELFSYIQGCYFTIGTLVIGIALGQVEKLSIDKKFIAATFSAKFIAWPLITLMLVKFDEYVTHIYEQDVLMVLKLISIAPIATNTVTISILFKIFPEKAATTVLLAAIFALIYMPLMVELLIK